MKFKLDECVDARLSINFEQAGYEAATVYQQGLRGIEDERSFIIFAWMKVTFS